MYLAPPQANWKRIFGLSAGLRKYFSIEARGTSTSFVDADEYHKNRKLEEEELN